MIQLTLIGIGTGNPDHVTLEAQKAMNSADLILVPLKGENKADLAGLRLQICRTCVTNPATRIETFDLPERDAAKPDYLARVNDWHDAIATRWEVAIRTHLTLIGSGPATLTLGPGPLPQDRSYPRQAGRSLGAVGQPCPVAIAMRMN